MKEQHDMEQCPHDDKEMKHEVEIMMMDKE
jgi:hypothetical protein